ncbi:MULTISPECIES: uridylate kinase [unclassified Clostridium]|uniref:amino acid kinase family protein n=1 Tax=unclassified Clostridium TaxID=2614128 RepID=UPI001106A9D3|nr:MULTISPECIES: uridylate kinase [unclassified Clostridium]
MASGIDVVVKIGSMALIRKRENDIDYNIISRLAGELRPGMILVSSGATEIGRLDYIKRVGQELYGDPDEVKTDYSAQGQAILMNNYRQFVDQRYAVRQILVEHQHFNDPEKREYIRRMLLRAPVQQAIPIINYNDPVSFEENRKMELSDLKARAGENRHLVECVDNDETAAVISQLVGARTLLILSSVEGIYQDPGDPATLVERVTGSDIQSVVVAIRELQKSCVGASRAGANGAKAKLEFVLGPVQAGTRVIIGHARHSIRDLLEGRVARTVIGVE